MVINLEKKMASKPYNLDCNYSGLLKAEKGHMSLFFFLSLNFIAAASKCWSSKQVKKITLVMKGLLLLYCCRSSFGKAPHCQKQVTKSKEKETYRKKKEQASVSREDRSNERAITVKYFLEAPKPTLIRKGQEQNLG